MLLNRGFSAIRAARTLSKNKAQFQQIIRNHGHESWSYRKAPPPADRKWHLLADIAQGTMWWWILWHLWTEPEHILGEFEYPDRLKWTDEELGIPAELDE